MNCFVYNFQDLINTVLNIEFPDVADKMFGFEDFRVAYHYLRNENLKLIIRGDQKGGEQE